MSNQRHASNGSDRSTSFHRLRALTPKLRIPTEETMGMKDIDPEKVKIRVMKQDHLDSITAIDSMYCGTSRS